MTKDEILTRLKEGNARYVDASYNTGNIDSALRTDLTENGQHPYAVIVACSDSRVVPEDIFMTGLGELFTIRVAGNVLAENQLGSIEYGVEHLGCPVVVILGHTNCGAVGASIEGGAGGHIRYITDSIKKVIGDEKDSYKAAVLNTKAGVETAKKVLAATHGCEDALVVGAIYDILTGKVEWL